jgi:hypothetical protein
MISWLSFLRVVHLVGLVLAVGAATAKLVLLLRCVVDVTFVPVFLRVTRLITRQIVAGLVLLVLSGVGWLVHGYPFTGLLIIKLVLVAAIFVLGPVIDNVVEPKVKRLAPGPGEPRSPAFGAALRQYLAIETVATLLFYVVIVVWVRG